MRRRKVKAVREDYLDGFAERLRERLRTRGWICVRIPGGNLWRPPKSTAVLNEDEAFDAQLKIDLEEAKQGITTGKMG